jgi:hypothetical protein
MPFDHKYGGLRNLRRAAEYHPPCSRFTNVGLLVLASSRPGTKKSSFDNQVGILSGILYYYRSAALLG